MIKKLVRRARRFRMTNQPRYPGIFTTLDLTVTAVQALAVIGVFGYIFLFVNQ